MMLLDTITLHNFGTYLGRQSVSLTPESRERPVILFGGLNGAGKTTLLDALQLTLFGPHARCSGRGSLAYDDYLTGCISRGADVPEAAVELSFRHMRAGHEHRFHLRRSWKKTGKGCAERLEVVVNDRLDPLLTEHWSEQVEEYMPSRLAPLFLYDGEKIEGYADPKQSAKMIATAVHSLLGLDLVERLTDDLGVVQRRKRSESRVAEERNTIATLEAALEEVQSRRKAAYSEECAINTKLLRARNLLERAEASYRQEGGALYDRRKELEEELAGARSDFEAIEQALRDVSAGPLPLLLVRDLLDEIAEADRAEAKAALDREMAVALGDRDKSVIEALGSWGAQEDLVSRLVSLLQSDRDQRASVTVDPVYRLSAEAKAMLSELQVEVLHAAAAQLSSLLESSSEAASHLEQCEAAMAAIPSEDALVAIVVERTRLTAEVAEYEDALRRQVAEREALDRDIERKERELERQRRVAAEDRFAAQDSRRVIAACGRVQSTLSVFKTEIVRRHAERIGSLVHDSLKQLLRKETLVTGVSIDPETFALELKGRDGHLLAPERMSAGERQLLSVAVLWGLARASSRPLPTVIDTPLGRLDSTHRDLLLTRYFPHASHQVILLSTDEEISGRSYETLRPWVGRSYALEFDESEAATVIRPGYFTEVR
jgi:DNA sulfur modification protein DndD